MLVWGYQGGAALKYEGKIVFKIKNIEWAQ
jgi:hypothetical protein